MSNKPKSKQTSLHPVAGFVLGQLQPRHMRRNLLMAGAGVAAARAGFKLLQLQRRPARKAALRGKCVIVTGASSGIGKALAQELAKAGCHLVLAARRTELLTQLATELESQHGSEVLCVPTDVSDPHQAQNLIDKALARFGQIDILVNNAGIATYCYFHKDDLQQMRKVMEVNYWGTVNCVRAVLPDMMSHHSGMIVNVSSVAGKLGQPGVANYCGSKHAVNGFSEGLRIELAKYGIHVLTICPTATRTDLVVNSANKSGAKFDPENFFGMSATRVARETVNAIADRRREHVLGAVERFGLGLHVVAPELIDTVLKKAAPFVFKD